MKILLDTNVLIWLLSDPEQVGKQAIDVIQAAEQRSVSIVSQFEVAIKQRLGRIDLLETLESEMNRQLIYQIPLNIQQFNRLAKLKNVRHRDPFDLLIIALAIEQGLTLITSDRKILAMNLPGLVTVDASK